MVRVSVAPKARRASSLWSRVRTCFAHGCGAGGLQAGEQNAGFDLRAGDGRGVVDGVERSAVDGERRVAVGEGEARAHGFERLANALHGAARERGVADEGEAALLRREQAGDHAHGGAGVAAVERDDRRE